MRRTAVDTNILARLLADVASEEGRYAEALLETSLIFVSKSVLMETEWILRTIMKIERTVVSEMMSALMELRNVECEDVQDVRRAIEAHFHGMDFADAIHVLGSAKADLFVTFDKKLVKRAKQHFHDLTVELAQ